MDGEKFDDLMRRFCTKRLTRLGAIRGMVAGAAALTATSLAGDVTGAKKQRGKGKQRGAKKARGAGGLRAQSVQTCLECESYKVVVDGGNPNQCERNRVDPGSGAATGVFMGSCGCKIRWRVEVTAQGEVLSFEPEADAPVCTVGQIIVKGGNNGANIYTFDSPTLCASGLTTPGTNDQGKLFDISHFDFCDVGCCKPTTCSSVGCTDGPICDGCGGTIDCPCVTNCPTGTDDGPNNTCDTSQGICVCDKNTCEDVSVECGTGFNDGCCGTFDCNCPTNCPDGTDDGPNNRCDGGKCVCTPDTCQSEGLLCTSTPQDDGCCGEFGCPCRTDCPPDTKFGPNTTCTDAGCVCTPTPKAQACAGTCGQKVNDGCCGEIDCDPCPEECESCTIGYYSQNQCRVDTSVELPCDDDSSIGEKCFDTYGKTVEELLTARGGDVICAQAAAAFLNQEEFDKGSCTAGIDICNADNETLSNANEEGDCPLQGCGNAGGGKPDKKKKKKKKG